MCVSENFGKFYILILISLYYTHTHVHTHTYRVFGTNFKPQVLPERIFNGPLTVISVPRKSLHSLKSKGEQTNANSFGHEIFIAFSMLMTYKT